MHDQPRQSEEPFRFLDLPAELRFMVYEFLPATIQHHVMDNPLDFKGSTLTLATKSIPMELLDVYRSISAEAEPLLNKQMEAFKTELLRLIVDSSSAWFLFSGCSILRHLSSFDHVGKERKHIREYGSRESLQWDDIEVVQSASDSLMGFAQAYAEDVEARSPRETIVAFWQLPITTLRNSSVSSNTALWLLSQGKSPSREDGRRIWA
jgi:hypothetical protein